MNFSFCAKFVFFVIISFLLSTICYINAASIKLNKNLSVIYFELIGILTFLLSVSHRYGDKFIQMVEESYTII